MDDPLILVADETLDPSLEGDLVQRLAAAGLRRVWLRVRDTRARARLAREWKACWRYRLTVSNDVTLAEEGVGLHDAAYLPPRQDPPRPYSRSAHDFRELAVAEDCRCDYAIFGTVWMSKSHPEGEVCGLSVFAESVSRSKIPLVAIGGITPERTGTIRQAGGAGIAVRSGILQAVDPTRAVEAYLAAWSSAKSTATSFRRVNDSSSSGTVQTANKVD